MTTQTFRIVHTDNVVPNRKRGGELRVLLSPVTVGSTSGFMGVAIVQPGEHVREHYHPYSEEYLYVTDGQVTVDLDGEPHALREREALLIPVNIRHRVRNTGQSEARIVFHLSPLAPRPELGHVDTEGDE